MEAGSDGHQLEGTLQNVGRVLPRVPAAGFWCSCGPCTYCAGLCSAGAAAGPASVLWAADSSGSPSEAGRGQPSQEPPQRQGAGPGLAGQVGFLLMFLGQSGTSLRPVNPPFIGVPNLHGSDHLFSSSRRLQLSVNVPSRVLSRGVGAGVLQVELLNRS